MLTSQKKKMTFAEAMRNAVDLREPVMKNDKRLFTEFAEAVERFNLCVLSLSAICRTYLDFEIQRPTIATAGAEIAALPYEDALAALKKRIDDGIQALRQALVSDKIGDIEWMDEESCRFTFFEITQTNGWLIKSFERVAHTHELVKARSHKLPATDVSRPKKADEILNLLAAPLKRQARIVTGMEVLKSETKVGERSELNMFGKAVKGVQENGKAIAAGAAVVATALAALPWWLAVPAQVAVADPAIVIGDVCLYGWE